MRTRGRRTGATASPRPGARRLGPLWEGPRIESTVDVLNAFAVLAALPAEAIGDLSSRARPRRYEPGEALFRVGDPSTSLVVIARGRVRAVVRGPDGRELVLHVAGPGEAPGHLDVLDGSPRSVDATALGAVEALALPATAVRAALLANPAALMQLAVELTGIVRSLGDTLSDRVLLPLPARLAKFLLRAERGTGTVELGMTQADLAAHLGVTRQSLNRALGALQRDGQVLVRRNGTRVILRDRDALRAIADGRVLSHR